MSLQHVFTIMRTRGFISEISEDLPVQIMGHALKVINVKTDFLVYKPDPIETHLEDEGRTLISSVPNLPKKVYIKLDDFKPPEQWDEIYEKGDAEDLKKAGIGRYVITFMLASEY